MNLKVARQPPDGTLAAPAPPQNKHTKDEHKRTRTHTGRVPITADLIIVDKMALRSNGRLTAASKSAVEAFEHLNHHVL